MAAFESTRVVREPSRAAGVRADRVSLAVVALLASLLVPESASGQAVRFGVMMESARTVLEGAWSEDPHQVERGYCITNWHRGVYFIARLPTIKTDTIFRVFAVEEAEYTEADHSGIDFECAPGVPELHTHTPTTCTGQDVLTCTVGGLNAYSCQPSRQDLEKLVRRGDPFAILQCDRHSFRFYYPSDYGPPVMTASLSVSSSKPDSRGNVTAAGTSSRP
jgi:hypothetical protein